MLPSAATLSEQLWASFNRSILSLLDICLRLYEIQSFQGG
jgi:hypothetical protein